MKTLRVYLAGTLFLLAITIVPVSVSFDEKTVSDTIRQARVNMCLKIFNQCTLQCGSRPPGGYSQCMQDCTAQYSRCMSTVARAGAGDSRPAGSPRPSVAPPRPPPRRISPERVEGVTNPEATSTASPMKLISPRRAKPSASDAAPLKSRNRSASPTPKPLQK